MLGKRRSHRSVGCINLRLLGVQRSKSSLQLLIASIHIRYRYPTARSTLLDTRYESLHYTQEMLVFGVSRGVLCPSGHRQSLPRPS